MPVLLYMSNSGVTQIHKQLKIKTDHNAKPARVTKSFKTLKPETEPLTRNIF